MKSSPIAARLFALQVSSRPEDAQELDFLEDYQAWVATGGPKTYDTRRNQERYRQSVAHYRTRVQNTKR